jgi:hypothetical protein
MVLLSALYTTRPAPRVPRIIVEEATPRCDCWLGHAGSVAVLLLLFLLLLLLLLRMYCCASAVVLRLQRKLPECQFSRYRCIEGSCTCCQIGVEPSAQHTCCRTLQRQPLAAAAAVTELVFKLSSSSSSRPQVPAAFHQCSHFATQPLGRACWGCHSPSDAQVRISNMLPNS